MKFRDQYETRLKEVDPPVSGTLAYKPHLKSHYSILDFPTRYRLTVLFSSMRTGIKELARDKISNQLAYEHRFECLSHKVFDILRRAV